MNPVMPGGTSWRVEVYRHVLLSSSVLDCLRSQQKNLAEPPAHNKSAATIEMKAKSNTHISTVQTSAVCQMNSVADAEFLQMTF